jgi:hypothetical protein
MADGVYPTCQHDGRPFDPQDAAGAERLARAGQPMPLTAAVVAIRGDWPAFCEVGGFRTWAHNRFPCFMCDCPRSRLRKVPDNISPESAPWHDWTAAEHAAEVARCRVARRFSKPFASSRPPG